jgi:oxygen-independent coproporphyrinogen-3 oxidase
VQAKLPPPPPAHPNGVSQEILPPSASLPLPGVYVHVPFCASTCDFCAFYQEEPRREDLDRYLNGIAKELALTVPPGPVDTIFWGGGTPSVLVARDLERLGRTLLDHFGEAPREWTVELAPSSVKADKLKALRDLGVNRLSLGVQSFDPAMLTALGRRHPPAQIYAAIDAIRAAGFENLNIDLIFSIPGQPVKKWLADLAEAVRIAPAHLSTYCLTFEEDTAMWLKLARGQVRPDSQADASLYETTWDFLANAGYHQYEISNYAKPGRECAHNLSTWAMGEWIGLGPSAASQFRGQRYANPSDLQKWLGGIESGKMERVDQVALTPTLLAADALIFGLRLNEGVNLKKLEVRFSDFNFNKLESLWKNLIEEDLLEQSGAVICLTRAGRLVADRVGVAILEAVEEK